MDEFAKRKNRAGNDFEVNAFARMIRNERYTGKLREGETLYTNIIPPIIDEKLFWQCNTIMDAHKHKSRRKPCLYVRFFLAAQNKIL